MELTSLTRDNQPNDDGQKLSPPPRISRAVWQTVLTLTIPILAQQMLLLVIQISDRYLAGNITKIASGEASEAAAYQAAQTTAQYLGWFITSYVFLVSVGSTALVARFTGAGDRNLAMRTTNQSILLASALGVIGSIAGYIGRDALVDVLALEGETATLAAAYLAPMFLFLAFQMVEAAGIACLVGAGDTRTGLYVMTGVAIINVPIAWGLCAGWGPLPEVGFVGIALGTALSHLFGGLAVLTVLACGRKGLTLRPRLLLPDWSLQRRLLRVSVPAGVDSLSVTLCQLWFLSIVNRLGDVAASAHGIALTCEAMAFLSGAAFGTTAMTLVGQKLGAGAPDLAAKSGWTAFGIGGGLMTALGFVLLVLAEPMFLFFCPQPAQFPIVEVGIPVLRLVAFAMPALAAAIIFTSALRGAGDTVVPVVISWIGFLGVRIPLAHYLALDYLDLGPLGEIQCLGWGLFGAWLAMCADIVVRGAIFIWRFAGGRWKQMRV